MARTYRLSAGRKAGNAVIKRLLRLRIAPPNYALLTVRGRRSGQERSTPVRPVEYDGQRWLVAPYGEVGWVRNVRAAGEATLTTRGQTQRVQLVAADASTAGPVLQKYIRAVPATRPYFDVDPKDPVEQFTTEAARHPVFRIEATDSAD